MTSRQYCRCRFAWLSKCGGRVRPLQPARAIHPTVPQRDVEAGLADSEIDSRQAAPGMSSCANATNDLNRAELFKTAVSQDDSNGQTTPFEGRTRARLRVLVDLPQKCETQSKILSRTSVYTNAWLRAVVKSSRAWSRPSVPTLPEGRAPLRCRADTRRGDRPCVKTGATQREVITAINRRRKYASHRSLTFRCDINADFRAALSSLLCWGVVGSPRYAGAFLWGVRPPGDHCDERGFSAFEELR